MSVANLYHALGIDKENNICAKDFAKVVCQLEEDGLIHLPDYGNAELTEIGKQEADRVKNPVLC